MVAQESALEREFYTRWLQLADADAPQPAREVCVIPGRRWRCDFVWLPQRVIVEVDGGQYKALGGRHNSDEDRQKTNALALAGYVVLRYSGTMIRRDPAGVIKQVMSALKVERKG